MKTGAPARGERVAKYNRLMDIEDGLKAKGEEVIYAGENFRAVHGKPMDPRIPFNVFGH